MVIPFYIIEWEKVTLLSLEMKKLANRADVRKDEKNEDFILHVKFFHIQEQ